MKLYYSPGSCSTCCHIALEESGLKHEVVQIDFDKAEDHAIVDKLNPMGTLPVLVLDNGTILSQNLSILTYIADKAQDKKLLPAFGTDERAVANTWLSFVAADLHKTVGGMFAVAGYSTDEAKKAEFRTWSLANADKTLTVLNNHLAGKDYIMGKQFTVVDSYAFIVSGWTKWVGISLDKYPNVAAFMGRVLERPAVQKTFKMEGLFD